MDLQVFVMSRLSFEGQRVQYAFTWHYFHRCLRLTSEVWTCSESMTVKETNVLHSKDMSWMESGPDSFFLLTLYQKNMSENLPRDTQDFVCSVSVVVA